jgi:uncharacterized protein (DUF1800 family)
MSLEGAIAANRFGLGARPGEIQAASSAPKQWLLSQLDSPADQPQPVDGGEAFKSGGDLVAELMQYRKDRQQQRKLAAGNSGGFFAKPAMPVADVANGNPAQPSPEQIKAFFRARGQEFQREMAARFALGFTTQKPFAERLVWFWSNHFTVSTSNGQTTSLDGAFEREAIRPNITGKFEDMVLASTHHPAMLLYLNNAQSIGPNSVAGQRSGKGINENLGRELMELHTLGVDGGYTQADVIAMAKILTGWSIARDGGATGFQFYPPRHEPGPITLRGKTYAQDGEAQGVAAIRDLARDPATARHIARQFAVAFIADNPSPQSVARLEKSFNQTGGDLKALAQTAVNDPAAWTLANGKMRSPVEYTTASMRLLGWPHGGDQVQQVRGVMGATRMMGEFPFAAPSPKGWPEDSQSWSGSDALLNRIQWAKEVGNRVPSNTNAMEIAQMGLGPLLQPDTRGAMQAATTPNEAVALLLSSPEVQRR